MPARIDNQANLNKNRRKFIQLFKRKTSELAVPVLNHHAMRSLLKTNRKSLELSQRFSLQEFLDTLSELGLLKEYCIQFPHDKILRYAHPDTSLYAILGSFYSKAYFSHISALFLHQLTEQIPKTLYLNLEQTPKPARDKRSTLLQSNIDAAFKRPQRKTNNRCELENHLLVLLNGKQSNNEGVEKLSLSDRETILVTGLERTLIDIAVRPSYSGGFQQVLSAFEKAKDMGVSINRLSAILKRLDYIYPYHQVIGFYLERAGYSESQLTFMEKWGKDYDFYLDYQLQDPDYSDRWRLFIPKGL